ncbi:MAG: helix-hairpin-helix domain-containing protein [Selenomonadaceae bacterium]|nr:helix-hairpin-helix domain-containing protein [Selenomonadaceae bacterium]
MTAGFSPTATLEENITKKKILIGVGIFSLVALAALFLIGLVEDDTPPLEPPKPPVKKISVYVSGQVKNISVVELEDTGNLRLVDAVNMAGGLTDLADTEAVNLAEPLTDGQHIHIPTKEIFLQEKNFSVSSQSDVVNINTADAERLATLKGIGPALAQRIIDYREQNGAFKSIDEIKNVRGIGQKKFDAFKDKITV